ncbi:DUF4190 domain-containing protein [Ruminococcus sp.]|uniref:DUF4190 domain-containing protein n=1 Tax=Ruminococcus sp. TaxID=41978 RepID=UPI0025FC680C|nr:DUF4190 domain-containing protein [Ruminococcus sp.]
MDNNYNNDPNNYGGQNNGNYPDSNNQYGGYDNGGQYNGGYSNNGQYNGGYPNNGQYNAPNYNGAPDFYSQMNNPYQQQYEQPDGKAIASLVLGLCNLLGWCLPIIGIPCGIVGLVMGIKGLKSSKKGMAIAGIVLSSITLAISLLNSVLGVIGALRRYS